MPAMVEEDSLLSSFLNEVSSAAAGPSRAEERTAQQRQSELTEKYTNQDLGGLREQHARLTASNYKWKNLNPYAVLQLGTDATVEDIKYRYRKLSARVHPDKLRGVDLAREAFEEVKNAYNRLLDEAQRATIIMNIEFVHDEARKERRRLLAKGVVEATLPSLEEDIDKRLLKHFADMELKKQKSEKNLHAHSTREKMMEDQEKEQMVVKEEFEKDWSEGDRREKRVDSWRGFQEDPAAKKARLASYKEEVRATGKFGQVKLETWKKAWK